MNYGIGNVKGKSGGGSVAVVEINASQIDENTGAISFTEAQYNTFNTNQLVVFQIESETIPKYLFSVSDDGTKLNCLNLEYDRGALQDQSDATLNVLFLYINKTPLNSVYTGYFINDTFSKGGGGKQLYNHLVYIHKDTDSAKIEAYVNIITDSSTAFTMSAFKTYISNTLNSGGRFVASGTYWDASNGVCFIHSLRLTTSLPTFSAHKQNTTMMAGSSYSISIGSDYSNLHITDTVITL